MAETTSSAFEEIKRYLVSPPVLVPPMKGKPLLLYVANTGNALGWMLAQCNDH